MNKCNVSDCDKRHYAKGYCRKHWERNHKGGSPFYVLNEHHGKSQTPEYAAWNAMRDRCNSPKNPHYGDYGGRGIKVCKDWNISFLSFLNDMGQRPFKGAFLDRIDNDKGYSKDNCQWISGADSNRNKRNVKISFSIAQDIRFLYASGWFSKSKIARMYSVSNGLIWLIINNRIWRDYES